MSVKSTVLIAATTLVLGLSAVEALTPRTAEEIDRTHQQQQLADLSDAHDREVDRQRSTGNDHLDAELDTRNKPAVHTPPPRTPRLRLR